ncbi:DMT family transporter [Litoribrevibacter euphylliae]|uniref:DMT family transporter n=1 Tax=Litoribrevibacter euphylliae TaxID=1834034 RepID=A0ABV7HBH7_9GAMM
MLASATVRASLLLLVAEFLLASMGAIIKVLALDLPNEMIVFFRNLFGLMAILPMLLTMGSSLFKTECFHYHLLRATVGVTAMYCFFYSIGHIAFAEAMLVKLSAPLFIPIIAFLWLGERISNWSKLAIVIGFIGVAIILDPDASEFTLIALIGLAGAALASLAKVTIRRMGATEPSARIVFYFALLSTLISSVPLLWAWKTPTLEALSLLCLMGTIGTIGQLMMTKAYTLALPGRIAPFTYASLVYASIYGWVFWDESLRWATIIGSLLIFVSGLLTLKKSSKKPNTQNQKLEMNQG